MAERRNDAEMRQLVEICEGAACRVAERVVEKAVPAAIAATFERFGIETKDPIKVQKDMAFLTEARERSADPEYKADRAWTRKKREGCERRVEIASSSAVKMAIAAAGVLLVGGGVAWMKGMLGL